jgi:very-short-patch-repair endonuclease
MTHFATEADYERFLASRGKNPPAGKQAQALSIPEKKQKRNAAQDLLESQMMAKGFKFKREVRFHNKRKWRFDYAMPDLKLAVEFEGGHWSGGRHTRGAGYIADLEKYNTAALLGWCVIRVTDKEVRSGQAIGWIEAFIEKV